MIKRFAPVVLVTVMAMFLTVRKSAAVDGDGRAALPGLQQTIDQFWANWEGGKPSDALKRAPVMQDDQRMWDELGRRADDFQSHSNGGRPSGHSEVVRKSLGDNMQYVVYPSLYDPTPLRVHLLLYRAKDTWSIIALRIDGDPSRWLDEAAQSVSPEPPSAAQTPVPNQ
jgi:hypothetical protein